MTLFADPSLKLVFVDVLFLCLAGAMALWFRAWLSEQRGELDRRIDALEAQQQGLAKLGDRLAGLCRILERTAPILPPPRRDEEPGEVPTPTARSPVAGAAAADPQPAAEGTPRPAPAIVPPWSSRRRVDTPAAQADRRWEELSDRSREAYRRARDLLEQGMSVAEIARQVGLGVAEVNVLKRMRDAGRR